MGSLSRAQDNAEQSLNRLGISEKALSFIKSWSCRCCLISAVSDDQSQAGLRMTSRFWGSFCFAVASHKSQTDKHVSRL